MTMAVPDGPTQSLVEILSAKFATLIDVGDVDIVSDRDQDSIEIQSDEWTIIIEGWPIRNAFVALDTLTDSDASHRVALDGALDHRDLAALTSANQQLEGAIARGLLASGDGVSVVLAEMIDS